MSKSGLWWYVGSGVAVLIAVFAAVHWPIAVPIAIGAAIFVAIAALKPKFLAPALVLVAIPLMRPDTFGEHYSLGALGLCILAAFVALFSDGTALRVPQAFIPVILCVAGAYLWPALVLSNTGDGIPRSLWQGMAITVGTVLCIAVVCGNRARTMLLGKMFLWLMLALCASYAVTVLAWLVFGVGKFPLVPYQAYSNGSMPATIYFPFTPSVGLQSVGHVAFPRFTGLGREPGWMGMYCAVSMLMLGRVVKPRLWMRALLILGLIGTFSTAGFGALMVGLGVAWLFRHSKSKDAAVRYFGLLLKLAFLGAALWVAVYAPVLGFAAKSDLNAQSLSDRQVATNNGIAALTAHPWGGTMSGNLDAINLVAALAPFGVPYALIVIGALLLPRIGHEAARLTTAPVFVILVTLLLSQPAGDSTFVFILTGMIYGMTSAVRSANTEPLGTVAEEGALSPLGKRG